MDYEQTDFNYRKMPMIFQNLQADGNLYMNTSFISFPTSVYAELIDIRSNENSCQFPLGSNLTRLKLGEYSTAFIHLDNITLPGSGGGMYVDFILGKDQTITLDFGQDTAYIQAATLNGSHIDCENVTSIKLRSSQPIDIVTKTPVINLAGNSYFGNLYADILAGIGGQDGSFIGNISFAILASDTYTLADNVSFNGKFDTASTRYNEFSQLMASSFDFDIYSLPPIVIILLIIPVALAVIFLLYKKII